MCRKEGNLTSRACSSHVIALESVFDIFERYLSYEKLLRIFAFCLRFVDAIKGGREKTNRDCLKDNSAKRISPFSSELEKAK